MNLQVRLNGPEFYNCIAKLAYAVKLHYATRLPKRAFSVNNRPMLPYFSKIGLP